ncbi:MAG: AMP-binding protein [Acidimicrobiia bacterium]
MPGWNFATVWDGIADIVPGRDALVCGDTRVSWGAFAARATHLARWMHDVAGVGRGDKVAIDLTNRPEYLETFYAALKLGAVPCNVNFRYQAPEVAYVLGNSDAKVVVHGPQFTEVVTEAIATMEGDARPVALEVGAPYETAWADGAAAGTIASWAPPAPDGDDLIFLYTGGTTGMPKGVMWRNDDLYRALWASGHPKRPEPPDPFEAARAGKRAATVLPAAPLMHGTGLFSSLSVLAGAGTVVLIDRPGLDAELLWDTVAREQVQLVTIVGDVFARPMLAALEEHPGRWDLSGLRAIQSSGVIFSPQVKQGLIAALPGLTIVDSLGASEGLGPRHTSDASEEKLESATFRVSDRVRVIDPDTGLDVEPGSDVQGLVAMTGNIPVGYYKDPQKTAATFPTWGGVRYSVPGDHATVDADGTVRLLGRGSACINTGGEKVFPEEVEAEVRQHPSVFDCLVVGVPDERFGERVVALVQLAPGETLDEPALTEWCRRSLAHYKAPRRFLAVDSLDRSAAGKANYTAMKRRAADLLAAEPG